MVSLFPKHTSLIKLTYFAFTLAGLINAKGSICGFIYMAYQWILINTSCIVTYTELIVGSREIQDLVQTLSAAIVSALDLTKLILFAIRRKKIRKLLDRLEDIRLTMLNDQENSHFITETETIGRKYLKTIFFFFVSFPFPSFILHTIIESMSNFKHKKLLVNAWFRWNREKVWAHILTNGLITLITQTIITISVGFYFMEITFTTYTSAYIKILRYKLLNREIRNKEIYEHHKVIIQLIEDYNEILSGQIYLEAVITPLVPCGFGLSFLRALQRSETSHAIDNCIKAMHCLMPTLVSCICGQQIINEMDKLHEATYMSNWYIEKPIFRKDLLMMMIRTTKPTSINYRLFVTFDREYFTGVLRVIYSYFTLMINLDEQ